MIDLFTPIVFLFAIIFLGLYVGKIRVFGIALDIAGVLGVSLLFGIFSRSIESLMIYKTEILLYNDSVKSVYDFLSSLGTSLFISTVGLDAGITFAKCNKRIRWRAFLSGSLVVMIGVICSLILFFVDHELSVPMILGLFSGSMTSTPALSMACELCTESYAVVAGYGISYCCGLFSAVIFVQLLTREKKVAVKNNNDLKNIDKGKCFGDTDILILISGIIPVGYIIKLLLPFGVTGGILIISLLIGIILSKKGIKITQFGSLRQLGLVMFFVGSGVPAGSSLIGYFSFKWMVYGICISLTSIIIGYFAIKKIFGFSKSELLSVICGGMTSTPAIGVLKACDDNVNLSLYAMSYVGALIMLLISVRCLFCLM